MTQKAVNNAKVLYRLNISRSDVEETHKIFTKAPFLLETLTNPVVSEEAKEVVLDKIARQSGMPELLENFMKMMCRIGEIGQITDIFNCYYEYWDKMNHILHAKVIYADDKAKEEKEAIFKMLENSDGGTNLMHESIFADDDTKYTRPWFSWANSVFCEFVMDYLGYSVKLH